MLEPDPEKRWPIEQVMQHDWVKEIEVCAVVGGQGKHTHNSAKMMGQTYMASTNGN